MTGLPQRHISEMETGKRQIGKERAKKLAKPSTFRITAKAAKAYWKR